MALNTHGVDVEVLARRHYHFWTTKRDRLHELKWLLLASLDAEALHGGYAYADVYLRTFEMLGVDPLDVPDPPAVPAA